MLERRKVLAGAVAMAAWGALSPVARAAQPVRKFPMPSGRELTVLVTGDAGTGKAGQWAVARAAKEVCAREGLSLAVGLGDNIYENGPESPEDDEFDTKFEEPNAGLDVPWLMVLGNHDCSGIIPGSGGRPARGDHEVAYHSRSARWWMPARYYSVAVPQQAAQPVVEFFALDTNPVASTVMQTDPHYYWNGPFMRAQRAWLDRALRESKATWKVVLAHHPFRNNGKHGNAGEYDGITVGDYTSGRHLAELYREIVVGRADYVLSGHDHTLQLLDTAPDWKGTEQVVCGAAAKHGDGTSKVTNKSFWQDFSSLGFMVMKIRDDRVVLDAYTVDADTARPTLAHSRTRKR
ncbi:metallophosphoesterase [Streptoalloteichus hindustanus]|uniref:Calcineurin-like phosphoesterase n=1 Tax=Streptoalloteichus hindustanus TaxID=2017 RepID=A0A1M5MHX4_STRHI|nr:metallophosphoesterase [Streptoalloteichus hindustanus]SHG76757.1 Calcineurin-like phosphoesterase [Streptoalloteichus hindustanus]